jgi:hypothetical protein
LRSDCVRIAFGSRSSQWSQIDLLRPSCGQSSGSRCLCWLQSHRMHRRDGFVRDWSRSIAGL